MRIPWVFLVGTSLSVGWAWLTVASGEHVLLGGIALGTGLLVTAIIAAVTERLHPLVSGTVRWRGSDRQALLAPVSRTKAGFVAFVMIALLAGLAFLAVMASGNALVGALAIAIATILSIPLAGLVVRPNGVAIMREGLLVRMPLAEHFVPWSAVSEVLVEHVATGEYGTYSVVRVLARAPQLIESNWFGRLGRRIQYKGGVVINAALLRVRDTELAAAIRVGWLGPASIDLSARPGAPQPSALPFENILAAVAEVATGKADVVVLGSADGRQQHVQIVRDAGQIVVGAASNAVAELEPKLTSRRIERLRLLGWAPLADGDELFRLTMSAGSARDRRRAASVILKALRSVYRLGPGTSPYTYILYPGGEAVEWAASQAESRTGDRLRLRNVAMIGQVLTIGPYGEWVAFPRGASHGVELLGPIIGASVIGGGIAWIVASMNGSDVGQWALLTAGGYFLGLTSVPGSVALSHVLNRFEPNTRPRRVGVAAAVATAWIMCAGWPLLVAHYPTATAYLLAGWGVLWVGFALWLVGKILLSRGKRSPPINRNRPS